MAGKAKIEIEFDPEKNEITTFRTIGFNSKIAVSMLLQECSIQALTAMMNEVKEKIVMPDKKIITPGVRG